MEPEQKLVLKKSGSDVSAWVGGTVLRKKASEVQHRGNVIYKKIRAFVYAPEEALESLNYSDVLAKSFFEENLWFILSTFQNEETLKKQMNRTVRNLIIDAGCDRRYKKE